MFKFVILALAVTAVVAAPGNLAGAPLLGLGAPLATTAAFGYSAPLATSTLGLSPFGLGLHSGIGATSFGLGLGLRTASPLLAGSTLGLGAGLGLRTASPLLAGSSLGLYGAGLGTYGTTLASPLRSSLALRSDLGFNGLGLSSYAAGW